MSINSELYQYIIKIKKEFNDDLFFTSLFVKKTIISDKTHLKIIAIGYIHENFNFLINNYPEYKDNLINNFIETMDNFEHKTIELDINLWWDENKTLYQKNNLYKNIPIEYEFKLASYDSIIHNRMKYLINYYPLYNHILIKELFKIIKNYLNFI